MSVRRESRPPLSKLGATGSWSFEHAGRKLSAAWISQPRRGESANGDTVVARAMDEKTALIAVVDALGHGPKAAEVAQRSAEYLAAAPAVTEVRVLVEGLHDWLQGSRGAAVLAFLVTDRGLQACSVGNVDMRSSNPTIPFVLTPGVLGVRLRAPKVCSLPEPTPDRYVLFSDGISGRFDLKSVSAFSTAELAKHLFASHRHSHDDSTVVVVDLG